MNALNHLPRWEDLDTAVEARVWTCSLHGLEYGDGRPEPHRLTWECPECNRVASIAEQQFRSEHHRHLGWRRQSGVPRRYRPAVLEHLKAHTTSAKALRAFVADYVGHLQARVDAGMGGLFLGPPGLGKTLAMNIITTAAWRVMWGAKYAVWPDVLADLKAGFNGSREDPRRQVMDSLRKAPLLLLDELGVKAMTEFEHGELFALIDHRYRHGLATIAAANATRAVFPDLVGERVADRLFEIGPTIGLTGDSLRGKTVIDGPDAFPTPPDTLTVRLHSRGEFRDQVICAPDYD